MKNMQEVAYGLFYVLRVFALFLILLTSYSTSAQQKKLPVLKAEKNRISLIIDSVSYGEAVVLNPKLKPDLLNFPIKKELMHLVFKSAIDSLSINLKGGENFDFMVINQESNDSAYLRAVGQKFTNPARFSKFYQKSNNLKTTIDIPPVYELINIVIALTPSAAKKPEPCFQVL
ncbi:hypothetical protein [Desertivirga arenae]|uniref:hypothetical protein n=1 Tax=Desertivirga arenae TaxID=2810309 RepID=UPI001A95CDBD|nr:hypothetical protein [Pedobacter sp. SYSU D00823]